MINEKKRIHYSISYRTKRAGDEKSRNRKQPKENFKDLGT